MAVDPPMVFRSQLIPKHALSTYKIFWVRASASVSAALFSHIAQKQILGALRFEPRTAG